MTTDRVWKIRPDSYLDPDAADGIPQGDDSPLEAVLGTMRHSSSGKQRPAQARAGDVLELAPGKYRHFRLTHPDLGGYVTIRGDRRNKPRILPNPVGGSHTHYAEAAHGKIVQNIVFSGDDLAAVQTENYASKRFDHLGALDDPLRLEYRASDLHYVNCDIDGEWDFRTATGAMTKWGILAYFLGHSAYDPGSVGFSWDGGHWTGIAKEHFLYLHGLAGRCRLSNIRADGCGRTFLQLTGREGEGPESRGQILVEDCIIENTGLEQGGGGNAITIKGGGNYSVILQNVVIRNGDDETIHPVYADNVVGAVVSHMPDSAHPVRPKLLMGNCRFVMGTVNPGRGSARRPCLDLAHLELLRMRSLEVWTGRDTREALVLDLDTIDRIVIDGPLDIRGDVVLRHHGTSRRFSSSGAALSYLIASGINLAPLSLKAGAE